MVPGLGIRCVDTNPWVTGAETCELVMALDCLDDHARALRLYADMQHLRHENGSYWTGYVYPDDVFWPDEQTTYTAAAVILAADELSRTSPASGIMRGETLAAHFPRDRRWSAAARTTRQPTSSPAAPEVRVSTRIDPTVPAGSNAPPATARCHTWNGAWPPSSGPLEHVVDDERAAAAPASGRSRSSRSARAPRHDRRR